VQTIHAYGGDKQECTIPGLLNFVKWRLILQVPQYGTYPCHPSGTKNFEVATRFVESLCTPAVEVQSKGK